jgi:hypothetical protein
LTISSNRKKKTERAGRRGGRGGRGRISNDRFQGAARRLGGAKSQTRNAPYRIPRKRIDRGNPEGFWEHDLFNDNDGGKEPKRNNYLTKVKVTGLNFDVMPEDLKQYFSQVGTVKTAEIEYDKTERSTGNGTVLFTNTADAQKAIDKLDGTRINNQVIRVSFSTNENSGFRTRNNNDDIVISNLGSSRKVLVGRGERKAPI